MLFDITEPTVQLLGVGLTVSASATMSADSDSSANLFLVAVVDSSLSGESDLVSAAGLNALAAAALSGESSLSATGYEVLYASSSMSVQSSLSVTSKVIAAAASIVIGASDLQATSTRLQFAQARIIDLEVVGGFTALVNHPLQPRPLVASSALTATIYTNPRLLVLPTVEYAFTENVLLERYPIDNGRSLLITSGVGQLGDFFAQEQIRLADYYFGGGRRHELTPEQEAAVVAAGYGDLIVTEYL
jgi:hypothetical protein